MSANRQAETAASDLSDAGALGLSSACQQLAQAAPSRRRKVAFWLIAGMLSVVCVEVPAGSTMFPFFTVWGLLVVWPLYLLHSVFLAGVVFRWGKPGFWPLYAAGMLYGMYEAYITKVVWVSVPARRTVLPGRGDRFVRDDPPRSLSPRATGVCDPVALQ